MIHVQGRLPSWSHPEPDCEGVEQFLVMLHLEHLGAEKRCKKTLKMCLDYV